MTGIVLAGGRSRRLGRDKAAELVGGRTLLQRALDSLAEVSGELLVVGRAPEDAMALGSGVRFLEDREPDRGPLAGLQTGLLAAASPYVWAVGCDMPFLDPSLLTQLAELAPGHDAVAPVLDGTPQTLHAVYALSCAPMAEALLRKGAAGLQSLLALVDVRYVEPEEMGDMERWRRSCFSVNTEADLEQARSWAAAGAG